MAKKLIIANWKLNPSTVREAKELFKGIKAKAVKCKNVTTVVCPPASFLALWPVKGVSKNFALGGQDAFSEFAGSFTGQVSPKALADLGAGYVIIGHSERRLAGDTDELINKKIKAAIKSGLIAVFCLGETVRDDHGAYLETIKQQLEVGLAKLSRAEMKQVVVAYEPVWAIGENATGADTPEGFLEQTIYIRKVISGMFSKDAAMKMLILYGGSVNAKNAAAFLAAGQADGLLIGRASLRADVFGEILTIANHV